jgi:hypothetical protein
VWSILRLARIVKSLSTKMPNKIIIGLHITAYLLIIVVNALPYIFADDDYI